MAKRRPPFDPRDVGEVLAGRSTPTDDSADGVPAAGERAHARVQRRRAVRERPAYALARAPARGREARRRHRAAEISAARARDADNAVFISYAREDLAAVQRLKAAWTRPASARGSTWTGSKAATTTTTRSSATSRAAPYFIPVVSATTERRVEGYFRREWSYAIDRTRNMAEGAIFILPCASTIRTPRLRRVPDKFRALHITAATDGEPLAGFVQRLKELLTTHA
jgi:hypothetical protein